MQYKEKWVIFTYSTGKCCRYFVKINNKVAKLHVAKKKEDSLNLDLFACILWILNPIKILTCQKFKLIYKWNNFTFRKSSYTKGTSWLQTIPTLFHNHRVHPCEWMPIKSGECSFSVNDTACTKNSQYTIPLEQQKYKNSNPCLCLHIAHVLKCNTAFHADQIASAW